MRYWEIDLVRGIAVSLMVIYHFIFDIFFPYHDPFYWIVVLTVSTFILVSGVSLSINYSRGADFKKFVKRGMKLFIFASVVTLSSFMFLEIGFILFGILHFFAVSSFIIYPFLKHSSKNIIPFIGLMIVLIGLVFLNTTVDSNYLIWIGLIPENMYALDFYPLFPWFGLMLIGTWLGNKLYPKGQRNFSIQKIDNTTSNFLQLLGRNSLLIYFIHQPILLFLLSFFQNIEIMNLLNL